MAGSSSQQMPDLTQMPAAPPPPGVVPNFNNPDNYRTENIILHSIVISFTTITVFVRVYTRAVVKRTFGLDDYLAILAWALSLALSTLFSYCTTLGFGMHLWDIRASEIVNTFKWFSVSLKIYMPTILAVKLCLLCGYYRVFHIDRKTKYFIWFGVVVNCMFYTVMFFLDLFRCKPIAAAWNPTVRGHCISYAFFPWVTGIFNCVSDFYILFIPMPLLFNLNMPFARRFRLIAIFGLGLFTCITSIMRVVVTSQASSDPDKLYAGAKEMHWPILEINVGLICACSVTFPAFFDKSLPRSFGSFLSKFLPTTGSSSQSQRPLQDDVPPMPSLAVYNTIEKSDSLKEEGKSSSLERIQRNISRENNF